MTPQHPSPGGADLEPSPDFQEARVQILWKRNSLGSKAEAGRTRAALGPLPGHSQHKAHEPKKMTHMWAQTGIQFLKNITVSC